MKKAFALVLAVAMIASMAVASFATVDVVGKVYGSDVAVDIETDFYTYNKNGSPYKWAPVDGTVASTTFGKTLYLPFLDGTAITEGLQWNNNGYVTDSDAVKGLKVSAKFETGAEYIKSVEIVKVGSVYALAFATTGSSLEAVEVTGEVQVKGKSYYEDNAGKMQKADFEKKFNVEIDLAWDSAYAADSLTNGVLVVGTKTVYDFSTVAAEDQKEFDLGFGPFSVETDVKNMKKVIMACDTKDNEELVDAYVDANLDFVNCEATFRRTATVYVDLAEGEYLYEIVDGALVAVDGEYDEWTEEFTFKTKKLGNYVISDTELVVEEVVVANPSTGAAA